MRNYKQAGGETHILCRFSFIAVLAVSGLTYAQTEQPGQTDATEDEAYEEIITTGSRIAGTAEDLPVPVSILDRTEIGYSPTVAFMIERLPYSSGVENNTNQFASNFTTGTANINLRGLGLSRTLVLLNGKRLVVSAVAANDGAAFVDINNIPPLAIGRIEVLKDGAAALYGSDAVAGVANFITRGNFEGLEVSGNFRDIDGADGDFDLGVIYGWASNSTNWVTSIGYSERSELRNTERAFITPVVDIPAIGLRLYGVSSTGNPGAFLPISATTGPGSALVRDPQCTAVGGFPSSANRCGFAYIPYSNLAEDEERVQFLSEITHTLASGSELYAEVLYSDVEVPNWKTSPSFPPVILVDSTRFIPPFSPGLVDAIANLGLQGDFSGGALFAGRPIGVTGPSAEGTRNHDIYRVMGGFRGTIGNGTDIDISLQYSDTSSDIVSPDTFRDRYSAALFGLGGPNCTGTTPGAGGCEFFNPFSSSITSSDPALQNSQSLLDFLTGTVEQHNSGDLLVFDAEFTGDAWEWGAGTVQYAAGFQYRDEGLDLGFNDDGNLALNPGTIDPVTGDVPGLFAFLRGGIPESVSQDIYAVFGELALPMADNVDVQLALRYEDYGGNIGDSIDPKVAIRWDVSDAFTLRASASTTFRGPSLIQTSIISTSLEFIGSELAFKAIDRVGNKNLAPEDATTFNIGLQWRPTNSLEFLLDYWNFDFKDGIVRESPNTINANCPNAASTSPFCSQISFQPDGTIARIITNYQNGPDIKTDGIDFAARYDIDSAMGEWRFALEGANVFSYDVDTFQGVPAFDAAGRLNAGSFLRPIPELKATFSIGWTNGNHDARLSAHYVDSYIDDGLGVLRGSVIEAFITELQIDSHTTADFHYSYTFNNGKSVLSFAAINLADEDPPAVRQDLRYDARTVSPLGIILQVGLQYGF